MNIGEDMVTAINSLKIHLGILGRADFMTSWEKMPGDLIYTDEMVAVFVDGCVFNGCPEHGISIPEAWHHVTKANILTNKRVDNSMKKHGWTTMRFFDCEVMERGREIAEEIVSVLGACKGKKTSSKAREISSNFGWARIARIEGSARFGERKYLRFLQILMEVGKKFQKKDLEYQLCNMEGWKKQEFEIAWKLFLWHNITELHAGTYYPGELLDDALVEAGMMKDKIRRDMEWKKKD
jgi:G:T-mismatch repair DNA endonuclease (very short patch repair protein)